MLAAAAALFACPAVVAQDGRQQASEEGLALPPAPESELPILGAGVQPDRAGVGVWVFLRMVLVLAIVVALIYLVFRLLRRSQGPMADDDQFLRRVASVSVGAGKSVQVVTLVDEAFVIGVAENSISVIGTVADKELVDAMNLYADKHSRSARPRNFAEVLELFMPRQRGAEEKPAVHSVFEDGASRRILDSFERQGRRLRDGE